MAAGQRMHIRRLKRRWRTRFNGWGRRFPILRRIWPFALSLVVNVLLVAFLLWMPRSTELRGRPDAPITGVEITVVQALPQPAETDEPVGSSTPEAAESDEETDPVAEVVATEEKPAEVPKRTVTARPAAPRIDLPETDIARGAANGLVGIDCDREFEDQVRAAECAGAEITSDWRSAYRASQETNEKWRESAEILRAGRYRNPFAVGPDRYGNLGENEQLYPPEDTRYRLGPGPTTFSGANSNGRVVASGGANYAEAFDTQEEYDRYLALRDERTYVGDGGPRPLTGWRPSWQLRDDPHIDAAQMREFLDGLDETENGQ